MRSFFIAFLTLSIFCACKTNPISGKSNLNFYGNKTVFPMAFKEYSNFLEKNKVLENTASSKQIKEIGLRIKAAAEAYFAHNNNSAYLSDYAWEFNLVDNPQKNAWCMPGGKIVFYTGILPIAKTADGIAAIMGHEVAHALVNHGARRMSAATLKTGADYLVGRITEDKPAQKRKTFLMAYGLGSQVGVMLPFSRSHESEADRIGVTLMTIAGYDPREAALLWERMGAASQGKSPPEILSTHPASSRRIQNIRAHIPYADSLAKAVLKP